MWAIGDSQGVIGSLCSLLLMNVLLLSRQR